jgi:hypothetical protein
MATSSSHKSQSKSKTGPVRAAGSSGALGVWEDDPGSGVEVSLDKRPDPSASPLAYRFPAPQPEPSEDRNSYAFRYWSAAAALRRGADFWAPRVQTGQWQLGSVLPVLLDEGEDLNAYYDRQALNFFHGSSPDGVVYSGASPDIVCHEMGHAILDSLKPLLWDAGSQEAAAFHESFADCSAILSDLQLPSLRTAILADTGGHLYRSSRLSRLAEQLGAAIRAQAPDAVDSDCLRNAVNSFNYADPSTLPGRAPASQLSSEPHSFSRLFTGAFFEALAGMLGVHAADPAAPTADELGEVSIHMRDIMVAAIVNAPVVSNFMAQVAAGMVTASGDVNPAYPEVLKGVFIHRSILSLQAGVMATSRYAVPVTMTAASARSLSAIPLDRVALPAAHYGFDEPLVVETPSHPRRLLATAAETDCTPAEPRSAVSAATQFLDDLFARDRVDRSEVEGGVSARRRSRKLKTHKVVRKDGALTLSRILFDCGFRHG